MMVAMEVVNRQKASEKVASAGGLGCPKCQGLGGLNCFGDPCKVCFFFSFSILFIFLSFFLSRVIVKRLFILS